MSCDLQPISSFFRSSKYMSWIKRLWLGRHTKCAVWGNTGLKPLVLSSSSLNNYNPWPTTSVCAMWLWLLYIFQIFSACLKNEHLLSLSFYATFTADKWRCFVMMLWKQNQKYKVRQATQLLWSHFLATVAALMQTFCRFNPRNTVWTESSRQGIIHKNGFRLKKK